MNEILNIIKLSLFQNALLLQIALDYQLPMSQIVQNGRKVSRIAINQKSTVLVLVRCQANGRIILAKLVEKRLGILAQGGLRGNELLAADIQTHPFRLWGQAVGADLFGVCVAFCAVCQNSLLSLAVWVSAIGAVGLSVQFELGNLQVTVGCFETCI